MPLHILNSHWQVNVSSKRISSDGKSQIKWSSTLKKLDIKWKVHQNNEEWRKVEYCRSFLQRKEDVLNSKIISLKSVFTRQSFPMVKYSINWISFFSNSDWSKNEDLFPMEESTCNLFLSSNKTQFGQKNPPESRRNESLLYVSVIQEEDFAPTHTEYPLTGQHIVETDFIWREQWN